MHVYLRLVNGEQIDQTVDSNICVIGRSTKCDIVVQNDGMSRQHCKLELENGEVFITDLGSTNGVLIDGEKIVPNQKTPYALYLSCSFGAVQSMQIELEELKGGPLNNRTVPLHEGGTGITTIVKPHFPQEQIRLETKAPGRPRPVAKVNEKVKDNKVQMWTLNILALIILAAAVYWVATKDDEPEDSPIEVEKSVPEKFYDQF